ncbi:HAD family phosphatase [Erythrobacter litoralis]|uniref:HAD family hydrolase n=1 Tax=Erythrobacter litoralis TaxID=39960 RepID=UPI002435A610|nr:HAD family phosphatase [Erythrobacter litoralis]MDG6079059.1 HAD family phosphatase [Erythrobacter litoralis]
MSDTIDAVVFDVGRVLFQWDLANLFGAFEPNQDKRERLLREVITEEWHFQHDRGRPLAEMVPERIAEFPEFEAHLNAYRTRFNETIPGPVPGSLELVERLHANGVPLFAITNFGAEFWAGFRPTQKVFDLFDKIIVSGDEKLAKPDPAIFALAAKRFGHAPHRMLFIDDNSANIEAAHKEGWQVHHFREATALERDLDGRGLL